MKSGFLKSRHLLKLETPGIWLIFEVLALNLNSLANDTRFDMSMNYQESISLYAIYYSMLISVPASYPSKLISISSYYSDWPLYMHPLTSLYWRLYRECYWLLNSTNRHQSSVKLRPVLRSNWYLTRYQIIKLILELKTNPQQLDAEISSKSSNNCTISRLKSTTNYRTN